jgi:hypothetical protein
MLGDGCDLEKVRWRPRSVQMDRAFMLLPREPKLCEIAGQVEPKLVGQLYEVDE